ncbi:MAG TPA: YceD family protein [Wenzhouxiangella sp.]|nr:YceD family protein [Wenzhouxiangella sp.]
MVFGHDEQRQVRAEVSVSGRVPLRCERTLKVFEQPIESQSIVGIVPDDRAAESLPEDYEPLLCAGSKIELVRLIGEEVLLGLPLVAIDPASSSVTDQAPAADTHRPFAQLGDKLRKNRDKDK